VKKRKNILSLIIGINLLSFNAFAEVDFKLSSFEKKPTTSYRLKTVLDRYRGEWVVSEMRNFISNSRPSRLVGTESHSKVHQYLAERIKAVDVNNVGTVSIEEFTPNIARAVKNYEDDFQNQVAKNFAPNDPTYLKWRGFTDSVKQTLQTLSNQKGHNIIWEKKGSTHPDDMIILGANFDSIVFDQKTFKIDAKAEMPGADDNATGVSALLSMIRILSEIETPKTIRIIFFDFQELGALGSHAYAEAHKDFLTGPKKPKAFVNLLMLGHDSKRTDKNKREGNMRLYIRSAEASGHSDDKALADKLVVWGDMIQTSVRFEVFANSFPNADTGAFWEVGVPAMVFSQNWEDDFNTERNHTSNDFVETINRRTFESSFRFITGAVISWAYDLPLK
jgi:acetylornithine deacetylase/succinyl-diaminopimelate desuccinylase-like protein